MKLTYDFHIHTALSPCGELSMTPNNIVNMALLNDLDVIAITDHNTCENVKAVLEVAQGTNLLVLPGIEVESREEIHIICLFSSLEAANQMQEAVYASLPIRKNPAKIFGEQLLFDHQDEVVGKLDQLLSFATGLSIDEIQKLVLEYDGVFIPAHIDRPSYSILSNLGMIPSNMHLSLLEISRFADYMAYAQKYEDYLMLQSSDAHELGFIGICKGQIEVKERSVSSVMETLKGQLDKNVLIDR